MKSCRIMLSPRERDGMVASLDVSMRFTGLEARTDGPLFRAQLNTVSIPCADPCDLVLSDDLGLLPYEAREVSEYPVLYRDLVPGRPPRGTMEARYTLYPRVLKNTDICGPYFDFRAEEGGANASGIALLLDCPGFEGSLSLRWNFDGFPGSSGVCTWGEGDLSLSGSLDQLRDCYYAFGLVRGRTGGDFGFYWLGNPPFQVDQLADYTRRLFALMQAFFRDQDPVYRVFLRHDPFKTSGGTALRRSYMFGWNDTQPVSVSEKQHLLAHEMVHNWPHLNDQPYGTTTWYAEGTAEFYSVMLPLRAGLITGEQALAEIQRRTDAYFTNPTRRLSDLEAAAVCWRDRRAQRLAYGRGFFFLASADAEIRRRTGARVSIDDVVLSILTLDRQGVLLGNELFLSEVRRLSGVDLTDAWRSMHEGGEILPDPDSFDALFSLRPETAREADTGLEVPSYRWALR